MKRILVVAAHPDDEILGCGGTVAKLFKVGYEVYILILGEGVTSRYDDIDSAKAKIEKNNLKKNMYKACQTIGAKDVFHFSLPDNRFDSVNFLDIVKIIEQVKGDINPDIVFTHSRNDLNIDHVITYRAVVTATRPMVNETVKEIYSFEILSSTEWNYPLSFSPNVYINIEETINIKINAMKEYVNEIREYPHPRSVEGIEILAKKRGMEVGYRYAEAFELVRLLK